MFLVEKNGSLRVVLVIFDEFWQFFGCSTNWVINFNFFFLSIEADVLKRGFQNTLLVLIISKGTHDGAVYFTENHVVLTCRILIGYFFGRSLSGVLYAGCFRGGRSFFGKWEGSSVRLTGGTSRIHR